MLHVVLQQYVYCLGYVSFVLVMCSLSGMVLYCVLLGYVSFVLVMCSLSGLVLYCVLFRLCFLCVGDMFLVRSGSVLCIV